MQEIEKLGFKVKNQYWNCCQVKKGYSGTAIFIDSSLENQLLKVKVSKDLPEIDEKEGRVITAWFKCFNVVCTYVPNSGVQGLDRLEYRVKTWDKELQRFLKYLEESTSNPVIWCGDLNVAHQEIDIYGASKAKEKQAGYTP